MRKGPDAFGSGNDASITWALICRYKCGIQIHLYLHSYTHFYCIVVAEVIASCEAVMRACGLNEL